MPRRGSSLFRLARARCDSPRHPRDDRHGDRRARRHLARRRRRPRQLCRRRTKACCARMRQSMRIAEDALSTARPAPVAIHPSAGLVNALTKTWILAILWAGVLVTLWKLFETLGDRVHRWDFSLYYQPPTRKLTANPYTTDLTPLAPRSRARPARRQLPRLPAMMIAMEPPAWLSVPPTGPGSRSTSSPNPRALPSVARTSSDAAALSPGLARARLPPSFLWNAFLLRTEPDRCSPDARDYAVDGAAP
jgi:hypothetical protein